MKRGQIYFFFFLKKIDLSPFLRGVRILTILKPTVLW